MRYGKQWGIGLAMGALGLSIAASASANTVKATQASSLKGTSITVAVAYPEPKVLVAEFTKQTGIKVNWNYVQWDNLQTKIASASEAHSYYADVADVDWSKTGEYYNTKWFQSLNKYFPLASVKSQYPQASSFIKSGEVVGLPFDSELMTTTINEKDLKAAGVSSNPTTLKQYESDLKAIQSKGIVKSPLDIPFAAAEGLSTYWYELTAAFGGQVLSADYKPLFTSPSSPGYKAMTWMINAYKSGLVPKANLNTQDYQAFETDEAHNLTASIFSDYSGDIGTIYNVPSESTVVGQVKYIPTPGVKGVAPNLGNPDGIGIPTTAKNVAGAVKFMQWFEEPANQAAFAGAKGPNYEINTFPLPSDKGGMTLLVKSGKVPGAADLEKLLTGNPRSIFSNGAPPWYAQFSNSVYTNIHSVATGSESVATAISSIASTVNGLAS